MCLIKSRYHRYVLVERFPRRLRAILRSLGVCEEELGLQSAECTSLSHPLLLRPLLIQKQIWYYISTQEKSNL
jgi:hypothetical protein